MPGSGRIQLRVTPEHKAQLKVAAEKENLSLTDYILSRLSTPAVTTTPACAKPELVPTTDKPLLSWVEPQPKPKALGWWEQYKLDKAAKEALALED